MNPIEKRIAEIGEILYLPIPPRHVAWLLSELTKTREALRVFVSKFECDELMTRGKHSKFIESAGCEQCGAIETAGKILSEEET